MTAVDGTAFLVGDGGRLAVVEEEEATAFRWAACEGSVTVATVLVLCDWRATLKRLERLVDDASCVDEEAIV